MSPSARLVAAAALLLGLAGCTGGGVTTHSYVFNHDVRGHVEYAASHGPTQAVIYNSPIESAAVISAMQGRNPGPPLTFVAAAADAPGYRVVISFGPSPAGVDEFCRTSNVPPRPLPSGRTEAAAVFCIGGTILSEASASADRIESSQDPRLARLMQDLLSALMPYNDPLYMNDSGDSGM